MEFLEGANVRDKIALRPLLLGEALDIAMQACAGLQAAHEKGVVHRESGFFSVRASRVSVDRTRNFTDNLTRSKNSKVWALCVRDSRLRRPD